MITSLKFVRAGCISAALAASACAWAGDGNPIYRCGQTYQQVPCDGGQTVDAADPRSADQRRDARDAAAADRRQAANLAAERREREKQVAVQRQPMGTSLKTAERPASAPGAEPPRPKKPHRKERPEDELPRYMPPASN